LKITATQRQKASFLREIFWTNYKSGGENGEKIPISPPKSLSRLKFAYKQSSKFKMRRVFLYFVLKTLNNNMKRFSVALINHRPPVQSYPRHLVMSSIPA
jgi:hypothetical protein